MKFFKIARWLLQNKEILDVFWVIYQSVKDGKITKTEFENITTELKNVVTSKIGN